MKKISIGLISTFLILLLAACGNSSSTGSSSAPSSGSSVSSSPAPAGQKIKLSIWHNWSGDDQLSKTIRGTIDKFQKDHPEIQLDAQAIPPDGYRQRLKTVAAANEIPDVFLMYPGTAAQEFFNGDMVQPITSLLDKYPDWKNNFNQGSYDTYTKDGQVYAVPLASAPTSIMFYNKSLFDKYKVSPPKTWSDLLAVIKVFKDNNVTPIALGNKGNWLMQSCVLSSIADRVTGTDWFLKAAQQNGAKFTDPQFVKALQYIKDLGTAGAFQDGYNSMDNTQMIQYFTQGKAAMMIDGGWALADMSTNATKEQMDQIIPSIIPSIPGGQNDQNTVAGVTGAGFAVSKKLTGAKLDAALQLVYALSGPEGQKNIAENNQLVNYKVTPDETKVSPVFTKTLNLMNTVKFSPVYDASLTSAATEVINNGLQELLLGGKPEDIAKKLQDSQAKTLVK
jgi:raffinose/stachyose/melibiose transport system substrate-binding protein